LIRNNWGLIFDFDKELYADNKTILGEAINANPFLYFTLEVDSEAMYNP
jgi:hypothetical protein